MKIVYNLARHPLLLFVPSAFIAHEDDLGRPGYAVAKVYGHNLESHGVPLDETTQKLFAIIDALSEDALEKKFNAVNAKRPKNLIKLWEDEKVRDLIQQYVGRMTATLLKIVVDNSFPLTLDMYRKSFVPELLLQTDRQAPEPILWFKKTSEGVHYRLSFRDSTGEWKIKDRKVEAVVNNPAWIMADKRIFPVEDINGNMVKPFIKNDEVFITQRFVADYFKKFILRVAAKADIEAEGFEMESIEAPTAAELVLAEDLLSGNMVLSLQFRYLDEVFQYKEKNALRTRLHFGKNDEIILRQYRRDMEKEESFANVMEQFDLKWLSGSLWAPASLNAPSEDGKAADTLAIVPWLAEHRDQLEAAGLSLPTPSLGGKRIHLGTPQQQFSIRKEADWFDLQGNVVVGEFSFPFIKLSNNLRSGDRYFALPDDSWFIIPEEWMHKMGPLFQLGKPSQGGIRIPKNQFTLLDGLNVEKSPHLPSTATVPSEFSLPEGLQADLRPYQLSGVQWLYSLYRNDLGACLADDMGLGKTLQTITQLLIAKREKAHREEFRPSQETNPLQLNIFRDFIAANNGIPPLNALIVLPASLVFNWRQELDRFAPKLTVCVHTGQGRHKSAKDLRGFDIILSTYHTVLKDLSFLKKLDLEYVILDESQQIKNNNSKIFHAVNELPARHKISLSGTPIENSLSDLWAQMQFINPGLLGSFTGFKSRYLVPIEKHRDAVKIAELKRLVSPYLLRRTKEAVAPELPELMRQVFYSEMEDGQRKMYEREKSAVRNYILKNYEDGDAKFRLHVLKALMRLRLIANHPVLATQDHDKALEWDDEADDAQLFETATAVEAPAKAEKAKKSKSVTTANADAVSNGQEAEQNDSGKFDDITARLDEIRRSGHKALIFSQFVRHLDVYARWMDDHKIPYVKLTGQTPIAERARNVEAFEKQDDLPFFLITLKAGGTGLNLTAADYVLIADPWWNPAVEEQAIARAHRIGQTKKVMALKFIAKDSIEEKILLLQARKKELAAEFIGGGDAIGALAKDDLMFLVS